MKPSLPEIVAEVLDSPTPEEQRVLAELFAVLASAAGRAEPRPRVRERLLEAVSRSPERWAPFGGRLSKLFDLSLEKVTEVLASLDDPSAWESGPIPGVSLLHFEGGPGVASADNGFVKLAPGTHFPEHRHVGTERILLVQGAYVATDGRTYRAGDEHPMEAGTTHSYVVTDDGPCIFAVTLSAGIEVGGAILRSPKHST